MTRLMKMTGFLLGAAGVALFFCFAVFLFLALGEVVLGGGPGCN